MFHVPCELVKKRKRRRKKKNKGILLLFCGVSYKCQLGQFDYYSVFFTDFLFACSTNIGNKV